MSSPFSRRLIAFILFVCLGLVGCSDSKKRSNFVVPPSSSVSTNGSTGSGSTGGATGGGTAGGATNVIPSNGSGGGGVGQIVRHTLTTTQGTSGT